MKKAVMCFLILLAAPFFLLAQYSGGNGSGDISVNLTNITLPVHELTVGLPDRYELGQNYPNPFNPKTIIYFQLPMSNYVKLIVYDVMGREVATLVNEQLNSGTYEIEWDASDYPSGIYFYTLSTGNFTETKRMVMIK